MTQPVTGSRAGQRRRRQAARSAEETPTPDESATGRGATLVAAGILLSRVSGLVREAVVAGFLGTGVAADAFKAALRIPNLLQNLLGEGVLSASFIPVYSRLLDKDEPEAGRTAGAVVGLLTAAVSVLVVVGMLAARPLTVLLTPGFEGDKLDLTVDLVRIMFPGVGLLVLSAWCLAILNSHRRFFLSYVAPVLWNVAQIVVVAAVAIGSATEVGLATALAWGVVLGGAAQLVVQLPTVRSLVPDLRPSLDRHRPAVRDAARRLPPVIFGRGVVQISGYVDLVLTSLLVTGALAAATYAQVLYLLPVSLFGMSIAAAELPELSRMSPADRALLAGRVQGGLRRVAYFVAPTAVFYVALGEPVVGTLFERGEFGPSSTRLVWLVLAAYSLGLLASTGSRLLQNSLYALDDPRTPARIALVRVVVSTLVALSVMFLFDRLVLVGTAVRFQSDVADPTDWLHLGAVGIALGSAAGAWVEVLLLRLALRWRIGDVDLGGGKLPTLVTAALAGAALGRVVDLVLGDLPNLVLAGLTVGVAGATYLGITSAMGMPLRSMLAAGAKRG